MPRLARLLAPLAMLLATLSPVAAQGPTLTVVSPDNGSILAGSDVTIDFEVGGFKLTTSPVPLAEAGKRPDANRTGEGHMHIMLDLQPVIVVESAEPYTLRDVAAGEHRLLVELVNHDHSPLSPPVTQQIRFRSALAMPETGTPALAWTSLIGALIVAAITLVALGRMLRGFRVR